MTSTFLSEFDLSFFKQVKKCMANRDWSSQQHPNFLEVFGREIMGKPEVLLESVCFCETSWIPVNHIESICGSPIFHGPFSGQPKNPNLLLSFFYQQKRIPDDV